MPCRASAAARDSMESASDGGGSVETGSNTASNPAAATRSAYSSALVPFFQNPPLMPCGSAAA
jgi:hypothetical protein